MVGQSTEYPKSMKLQHAANVKWMSRLVERRFTLDELARLIERYMPAIIGLPLDGVAIDLSHYNVIQDTKHGRTISRELLEESARDATRYTDGFYVDSEGRRGLVVQQGHCIGLEVTKSRRLYKDFVQMGQLIVCRGDKASSRGRKTLGFDGNYKTQRILLDKFDMDCSPLTMAAVQWVQRYGTHSENTNVVHTEGHVICHGKVRHKREKALANMVKDMFGPDNVVANIHLPCMEGLEFDLWIPSSQIAIEYQGQQHELAVEHWGGHAGLEKRQAYDERKRQLAKANGIKLIEIWYHEEVSRESLQAKLSVV